MATDKNDLTPRSTEIHDLKLLDTISSSPQGLRVEPPDEPLGPSSETPPEE